MDEHPPAPQSTRRGARRREALLLVEDDALPAANLLRTLARALPDVHLEWVTSASDAVTAAFARRHDAAIIDVALGKSKREPTGLDVCRRIRSGGLRMPLVVWAAGDSDEERLDALDAGADDFVSKWTHPEEVVTRVRVAMRRGSKLTVRQVGPLRLDLERGFVSVAGTVVEVSQVQWRILLRLSEAPGEAVPAEELSRLAGVVADSDHKNLSNNIHRLRERLGDAGCILASDRNRGWLLRVPAMDPRAPLTRRGA